MKIFANLNQIGIVLYLMLLSSFCLAQDPLPSWNDVDSKKQIMAFVESTMDESSNDYVKPDDRVVVFDNDGTLWAEQPLYFQLFFVIDRIKSMAKDNPKWQYQEPYASILKGDIKAALKGGEKSIIELVLATHAGMTTTEFEAIVSKWIVEAKHPETQKPFIEMVYQPMLELLSYLQENDFRTYIVSGGGIEFMRPWAEQVYGIPKEQVIGSSIKVNFELDEMGKAQLIRQPELNFIDDKEGKPIAIHYHIGKRPIASFGNSNGDLQMMQWTTSGEGKRLAVYIHHTDDKREWAYDRDSSIGHFDKALDEAQAKGWVIVDMKNDWSKVFSFDK